MYILTKIGVIEKSRLLINIIYKSFDSSSLNYQEIFKLILLKKLAFCKFFHFCWVFPLIKKSENNFSK